MAERKRRRALGRGLDALLPARPKADTKYGAGAVFSCPIELLAARSDQPRHSIDPSSLDELAATIEEYGIIQPLVVRRLDEQADSFQIIAGERRWRAAQRAGLREVPVVVKDVTPERAFELALIENLQRQDLNPIEVAEAYERLLGDHDNTQEQLASRVGKSRVAVTNALRLLKLPEAVRAMLTDGSLSEGHGRALLGAADETAMLEVAQLAARGRLSVRKVEQLVRKSKTQQSEAVGGGKKGKTKSAATRDLELRLSRRIGARTSVEHRGPGGKLVVSYADLDELDRIIAALDA